MFNLILSDANDPQLSTKQTKSKMRMKQCFKKHNSLTTTITTAAAAAAAAAGVVVFDVASSGCS